MTKFWSTLMSRWPNMWKFLLKVKNGSKNVIFSRGVESGVFFTSNSFVSMIRCSKHFWGTCFHPNILMSSHLLNWRKKKFRSFDIFHFFWPFLRIFSLLKIAVNRASAILTNSLRLKTFGYYQQSKNFIFHNYQHLLIFGQHFVPKYWLQYPKVTSFRYLMYSKIM